MVAGSAEAAVAAFAALRGTHEQPPGSNNVPGITDFLYLPDGARTGPSPWCVEVVSRVLFDVGVMDLCDPAVFGGWVNGCAYVPYITRRFRGTAQWIPVNRNLDRPGDLPIFVFPGGDPEGDHLGMMSSTAGGGLGLATWEGNSPGPDPVGDEVALHTDRVVGEVLGYVRPTYGTAQPPTPVRPPEPPPVPQPTEAPPYGGLLHLASPYLTNGYVREWQARMSVRGWRIAVDGIYGPQSAGVCHAFELDSQAHGWPIGPIDVGIVGPYVWRATWARPVTP